jgi:hypothetical protein
MANAAAFQKGFDEGRGKAPKGNGKSKLLKQPAPSDVANPNEFKHGGKVKKTGYAKVHKNEIVLTAAQAKAKLGKKSSRKSSRKKTSKR